MDVRRRTATRCATTMCTFFPPPFPACLLSSTHLNVVSVLVNVRRNLPADPLSALVDIHLISAGVANIMCGIGLPHHHWQDPKSRRKGGVRGDPVMTPNRRSGMRSDGAPKGDL